jgi:hypothetical protein
MFFVNIFLHIIGFDLRSSLVRNMALTTSIPSNSKNHGLFFTFIAYTKSKKEKKIKILQQNNIIFHMIALLGS